MSGLVHSLFITLVASAVCSRQSYKCTIKQHAIPVQLDNEEIRFLCIVLLLNEIYLPTFFIPPVVSELCSGQSSKCKHTKRTLTLKLGKTELPFSRTALLLYEIYLPTKFLVGAYCSASVMPRTNVDGRTKRQLYSLSAVHYVKCISATLSSNAFKCTFMCKRALNIVFEECLC